MKALTIKQPWAWAIVWLDPPDAKRIENRDWYHPAMIGEQFAIHTSKNAYDSLGAKMMEERGIMTPEVLARVPFYNVRGAIIGLARIDRVIHAAVEDPLLHDEWFEGPYGLVLRDVIRLTTPVPARGNQGWWNVSPADVDAIRKQKRISVPNVQ